MLMEWFTGISAIALVLVALVTILIVCHPSQEEREELREQKIAYKNRSRTSHDPHEIQRRNVTLISLLAALFFVDLDR